MISVAKVQRRNAWRYYVRGVAFGDGRRPAGQALKDAQEMAGLPPGVWMGLGLAALRLTAGQTVTERQMELVFGDGRHPDADRMERKLLDDGEDPATARLATVLGQPLEEIEQRKQIPLIALDFVFRPQASLVVLWALGDASTRRVIEKGSPVTTYTCHGWRFPLDGARVAAAITRSSTSLGIGSSLNARTALRLSTASYTSTSSGPLAPWRAAKTRG
jgi:hypothetical protein